MTQPLDPYIIPPEMAPINSVNPWFTCVSPARQVMATGNLSQANVIAGATRKRQRCMLEKEYAKGTFKHEFVNDVRVLALISRFNDLRGGSKFLLNPTDVVIVEDYETSQMDIIELTKFHIKHQHYGFRFKFNEDVYNRIHKGQVFRAGTVIATSPNVTDDGDYMYGRETNVCMISDPAGIEDGIAYSRSYSEKLRTTGYESRTFTCGRNFYPINSYGNVDEYKPIPDIGEMIHSNGLVCAMRPYDEVMDAIYMTRRKLFKPVYGMDVPIFGIPDAKVVDIRVMHNPQVRNSKLPQAMKEQFLRYYEADKQFYMEIIRVCLQRTGRGLQENADLSPRLREVLYNAIVYCGEDLVKEGLWPKADLDCLRAQRLYRGEPLDEFQVEIIYEYLTPMGDGIKATDVAGGKGVVTAMWEDEDMPVDDFGNRADMVIFSSSTVNRMNPGRIHEQLVGAAGRDVIKRIRRHYHLPDVGPVDKSRVMGIIMSDIERAKQQYEYLVGFYEIVSPNTHRKAVSIKDDVEKWTRHLCQVIMDGEEPYGAYLDMRAGVKLDVPQIIRSLSNGIYRPEMSPVVYTAPDGRKVRTYSEHLIGPIYQMGLEKMATDWSGTSSSKTNHFGVTSRLTNADKHTSPGRQTSTKTSGEAENRGFSAAQGAEILAHIMDLNNNPTVHKEVCRTILTAEKPTDIDNLINREDYPLGNHRGLSFVNHNFACSGKSITRE